MAVYSYSVNYLIDCEASVIMDVAGSGAIRQAEVNVTRDMIESYRHAKCRALFMKARVTLLATCAAQLIMSLCAMSERRLR